MMMAAMVFLTTPKRPKGMPRRSDLMGPTTMRFRETLGLTGLNKGPMILPTVLVTLLGEIGFLEIGFLETLVGATMVVPHHQTARLAVLGETTVDPFLRLYPLKQSPIARSIAN
jgi:hypothetical protein